MTTLVQTNEKKEPSKTEETGLVAPADSERMVEAVKRFEQFKQKALGPNDYVVLEVGKEKKPYIKKSGWMKFALACQLSLEKRDEREENLPNGTKIFHYTYRAIAPSGRFADAVGSASTTERQFAHPDHDVRALAQTRACNRAVSNLVAGGEVSAEEMVSEITERGTSLQPENPVPTPTSPSTTAGTTVSPQVPPPTKPSPEKPAAWKVPLTKDQATAAQIQEGVRQFPLIKGVQSYGMVNTLLEETSVVPERPVPIDTPLVDGFLLRKIIEPLVSKHGLAYTLQRTSNGLLEAVLIRGKLPEQQLKELVSGARWSFERSLGQEKK